MLTFLQPLTIMNPYPSVITIYIQTTNTHIHVLYWNENLKQENKIMGVYLRAIQFAGVGIEK